MLGIFENYYTQLYASQHPSVERFEELFSIVKLLEISVEQQRILNKPITLNDIINAIDMLRSAQTPGPDEFTSEFYKTFKFILAPKLHRIYTLVFQGGFLPDSWKEALMVVIPKEGKDLSMPQLYRPISLLNTEYKILTSILDSLLMKVLQVYIGLDQTSFLKVRNLSDSVQRVINIINVSKNANTPRLAIFCRC